jgi:hypothetical protein
MEPHYDEAQELFRYRATAKQDLMTPLELRAESLGMLRVRAMQTENPGIRAKLLSELKAKENGKALKMIGSDLEGFTAFQQRVADRIKYHEAIGRITINRCPACNRIVRTPMARQCLWCGHDWH